MKLSFYCNKEAVPSSLHKKQCIYMHEKEGRDKNGDTNIEDYKRLVWTYLKK